MKKYTLNEYISVLENGHLVEQTFDTDAVGPQTVELVSCDSQDVTEGTLFIVKGAHFKSQYLDDAHTNGAFCYIAEKEIPEVKMPWIQVKDVRLAMAHLATFYYNDPWKNLHVTGITGTKGKSSAAYYIKSILDEYSKDKEEPETAVVSSIDTYDGKERFESHLTTPEPLDLERHFSNAVASHIKYLTMEVSSQALKYDRVLGVQFEVGAFLNIGYDHISPIEHPTWEDYFQSKLKIFSQSRNAVVNLDSDHADEILAAAKNGTAQKVVTFSEKDPSADVYGFNIHKEGEHTVFRVRTADFERDFRLSMPGLFNVSNALAAIAICGIYGIPQKYLYRGLMKARVPGRMEIYANATRRIIAIVDYAHNRLSFEKLFQSVMSEYPGRRIVIVFGCPGKKALDRRHDLGEIAGKYAAHVYLTEEDPGEEDAASIDREIATAVAAEGTPYSIITDRGEAIRAAIGDCEEDTVVLITGKGAETREKRGLKYVPVPSDVEYARKALHEYDVKNHLDGMTQVRGLLDTLPRLYRYENKIIVVKYGGSALAGSSADAVDTILEDVAALRMAGAKVVIVHGGGKNINHWLNRMGVESHFEEGYRVTDDDTMDIVEMALSAQVNKQVVSDLRRLKVRAVGISGRDGGLLDAEPMRSPSGKDLGHVGRIVNVNPQVITALLDAGFVPVISPVAMDDQDHAINVNADDAACAVAEALKAEKLVYLTNVDGIMMDKDNDKTLLTRLTVSYARELLDAGLMTGGMVPKLLSCIEAIRHGVHQVVILDGRVEHTVLLEAVSNETMGTVIVPDKEA